MNDDPEYEILAIRGRRVLVHRLVALAFLGERPVEMEVHHKDHSKRNNKPINLEYVSRSENIRHAYRAGRIEHKFKLHAKQQQRIIEMYETGRYKPKQLAAQFGVDRATIYYLFRLANVKLRPVGKMRKLTTEQYDEIRRKWIPHRYSARQLAEEYSVSHALVEWILGMRTNRGKPCTIGHPELVNTRHATKIANHAQERESAANVAAEARNG